MTSSNAFKVIVNTPTRTGSTFLCNEMVNNLKISHSGITKTHDPDMLKNGESMQIVILRNPTDSIASMISMDKRNGSQDIVLDITDRISHFGEMLDSFCTAYNKTVPFLFEDVVANTSEVINFISDRFKIDYREAPLNNTVEDRHNFVKTSKTLDFYDNMLNSLLEYSPELSTLEVKYFRAIEYLKFRQKELGFIQ